jgi:hypothetical protein
VLLCCFGFFCAPAHADPDQVFDVIGLNVVGSKRTNITWMMRYLGLHFPSQLRQRNVVEIEQRLLTTEVFVSVGAKLIPTKVDPKSFILEIDLNEKWTTIPVVRAAFGGGTPLAVVGIYDTHAFGSLWTLGGELQRYGTAPWGGVVWARAPRAVDGRYVHGIEVWRQFRVRTAYDDHDEELGTIRSDWSMLRILLLAPFQLANVLTGSRNWRGGLDLRLRNEAPSTYNISTDASSEEVPDGIRLSNEYTRQVHGLLNLVYDNMQADQQFEYSGLRLTALSGPMFENDTVTSRSELEAFLFYYHQPWRSTFASHGFIGQTTNNSVASQYFLGGFESIRGIPDGAVYGTRASYFNFEWRYISAKWRYLWLQNVAFVDTGGAGQDWQEMGDNYRSSIGTGVRLAVPQVYRLMFRIDYAWSLDQPGTSGITAGMNQFFQPYKPL